MLHGNIELNHNVIGNWRAVRKEAVGNSVHRYRCVVEHRNIRGYLMKAEFNVEHAYVDGALILASKVLAEAPRHLVGLGSEHVEEHMKRYYEN